MNKYSSDIHNICMTAILEMAFRCSVTGCIIEKLQALSLNLQDRNHISSLNHNNQSQILYPKTNQPSEDSFPICCCCLYHVTKSHVTRAHTSQHFPSPNHPMPKNTLYVTGFAKESKAADLAPDFEKYVPS